MKKKDTMAIREEWLMEVLDTLEMLENKAETNGESKVMYEMIRTLKDNLEIEEQGGNTLFFLFLSGAMTIGQRRIFIIPHSADICQALFEKNFYA